MSDTTSGTRRVGATLLLFGTFALGMIAGAALLHIALRSLGRPPGPPAGALRGEPPLEHLQRTLALTREQSDRLREIFDDSRGRIKAQADATRDRIRAILTPEQREEFDAMRPPHPPPGMPPGPFPPGMPPDGPPPPPPDR